jgi:hypothetical protein
VTVIDRANHHLFQPLLYQVATAGLSAPAIGRTGHFSATLESSLGARAVGDFAPNTFDGQEARGISHSLPAARHAVMMGKTKTAQTG